LHILKNCIQLLVLCLILLFSMWSEDILGGYKRQAMKAVKLKLRCDNSWRKWNLIQLQFSLCTILVKDLTLWRPALWKSPTRANHNMKKKGLYFICRVFVVRAEIKVTLLMPSFSSILLRLFLFNIEDLSILMMIFLSNLMAMWAIF
jgi:hypothetical protein